VLREDPERWRATGRACGLPPVEAALLETQLAPAGAALAEPPVEVSPEEQHRRLLGAVTDVLLEAGDATPGVLVVEDLHWADPTTLELLERLVRELATEPILLLVTLRAELAPAWASASYATVVTLDHLGAPELEALVGGILNVATPPDGLVSTIEERSDGVPLFAEELLLALRDAGIAAADGGRLGARGPARRPRRSDTLHDLLLARLDRLGTARIVAQVGAVLGRRFDRELLQEVAAVDERVLDEGLARLVDAELLHVRGRGASARYFFKHALIRDAAYASLVRSARRSLHARVARMLEERRPDSVAAAPEVLARHLDAAGDHVAAASSWLRAGALALRAPAYVEAMAHYEAGLRTLQALPGEAPQTLELDLQLGSRVCPHGGAGLFRGGDPGGVRARRAPQRRARGQRAARAGAVRPGRVRLRARGGTPFPRAGPASPPRRRGGERHRHGARGRRAARHLELPPRSSSRTGSLRSIGRLPSGILSATAATCSRSVKSRAWPRTRRVCSCSAGPGASTRRGASAPTACASRARSATRCLSPTCSPASASPSSSPANPDAWRVPAPSCAS
jgi:hypothetical protein